jgi:hypothetical protein
MVGREAKPAEQSRATTTHRARALFVRDCWNGKICSTKARKAFTLNKMLAHINLARNANIKIFGRPANVNILPTDNEQSV